MKNLYLVNGGLGKNILFTSLIPSLCEKSQSDKISIMCTWKFIFDTNERVDEVHDWLTDWRFIPHLSHFDNLIYHEPYHSNYVIKDKHHILNAWSELYGIETPNNNPYINKKNVESFDSAINTKLSEPLRKKDYCVVQFTGGKEGRMVNANEPRDYRLDLVQTLLFKIYDKLNLDVICFRHDHEPNPEIAISFQSESDKDTLSIIPIIENAKLVICIDSSLMHFAASCNHDKVIVLWNELYTKPERIGYSNHNHFRCSHDNPIDIDPSLIFHKAEELLSHGNV